MVAVTRSTIKKSNGIRNKRKIKNQGGLSKVVALNPTRDKQKKARDIRAARRSEVRDANNQEELHQP